MKLNRINEDVRDVAPEVEKSLVGDVSWTAIDDIKEKENRHEERKNDLKIVDDNAKELEKQTAPKEKPADMSEALFDELKNNLIKEELEQQDFTDAGISKNISDLVKDEWEAIDGYNAAILYLEDTNGNEEIIAILKDILEEEYIHVGQLEKVLTLIAPISSEIEAGKEEAEEEINKEEKVEDKPEV